ncbi:hypothetical protein ACH4A8_01445 [Streptomyces vietnamensis]|uniref:hypothetical protein n=1 Tax=Streptomyces vietnamensis TaxID=362257 RepID=UPI0037AC5195
MKLSPNTNPPEPDNLLIRFHNQTGAAVDVTGTRGYHGSHWRCHGCGDHTEMPDSLLFTRRAANEHAATCRASYHRLR